MKHIISLGLHWREAGHLLFGLSMLLVFMLAGGNDLYAGDRDHRDGFSSKTNPSTYGHRYSKSILRGVKLSDVYTFNDTVNTDFGPAYANVWTSSANFLQCTPPSGRPFSYALCYYSGPDAPTGDSDENPSLPCTLSPDGTLANCTCFEISTDEVSPKMSYLVDIHAISNLDIYQETVEACGEQGAECLNSGRIPPVCEAINTNLLVPGADLISVYSERYKRDYVSKGEDTSTECTDRRDQGVYAGCMTAPCYRTGLKDAAGRNLVECKCPVYDGPFQIGQGDQSCNANDPPPVTTSSHTEKRHGRGNNVWSAAYNPAGGPIILSDLPCIPDSPGDSGCPLYEAGKDYNIEPDGALCQRVCGYYGSSNENNPNDPDIQLGYSCDATLCTTVGIGQDGPPPDHQTEAQLLGEACSGIQNMNGLTEITLVEALAECSCCASQICGCDNINAQTNAAIVNLNAEQTGAGIMTQCVINNTLCGAP